MRKWIENLLLLQSEDIRIRNLETKLQTIPLERAKLITEFEVVKKALAEAKNDLQQAELELKKVELAASSEAENMKKLQIQSATVKKNTEYQAMLTEIEACKLRISDIESKQLVLMDEVESKKIELRKATKNYNSTGRAIQTEVRELEKLKEDINSELREHKALSKYLESKVEMNALQIYKRLLSSGKGSPLAAIKSGMCSNCNLKLTPMTLNQASKGTSAICDNCSHMLYDPDAKND